MSYHPLHSPLELPVQVLKLHCLAHQPIFWTAQAGSTPSTTLAGSFGQVVWQLCAQGVNHCEQQRGDTLYCQQGQACPVHWLYKPFSSVHRRDFARPVFLYSPTLIQAESEVSSFELEMILWGRHAVAAQAQVLQVVQAMGQQGLRCENQLIPFSVIETITEPVASLGERLARWHGVQRMLLEFITPLVLKRRDGETRQNYTLEEGLPLSDVLANVAYEWVAWDLEDRLSELDKTERHQLACTARDATRQIAAGLTVNRLHWQQEDLGTRFSRSNRHVYDVSGFVGLAEIGGDVWTAAPWLLALCLAGGGQRRALGFGTVRAWLAA